MIERIRNLFIKKCEADQTTEEKIEKLFNQTFDSDILRLEVGSDIAEFCSDICSEVGNFRDRIAGSYGFIFPPFHVIQIDELQENEIKLFVQEKLILNDFWVPNEKTVVSEIQKILEEIYKNHLDDIFSNELFEKILNKVQVENAWLVWNVTCQYTSSDLKKVFLNILKQKKSIKNAKYIFEKIGEISPSVSSETLSKLIVEEI